MDEPGLHARRKAAKVRISHLASTGIFRSRKYELTGFLTADVRVNLDV